ncbi:MAG: bifunctional lysylphosphatidylglycerol flippase/synthetase MprF [Gemmatimonadota bacterium]|jgi:phosphatidylglycerol lysyltransferase
MKIRTEWLRALLPVPVFLVALCVIRHDLTRFRYHDVAVAVADLPNGRVAGAVALTILSFALLSGYDWMALRYVSRPLGWGRTALASFIGYAFSNALGFPLLTGAPIRYYLYSGWGVTGAEIRDIVTFYSTTLWVGFFALAGTVLLVEPLTVPGFLHLPFSSLKPIAAIMLLFVLAYLAWAVRRSAPVRVRAWEIEAPGPRLAVGQVVLGVLDWAVAAAVLYALLPTDLGISFGLFTGVFMIGQIAGLISHVPGGLGVFEAVLLALLPEQGSETHIVASLVIYRGIYYLMPLIAAALSLGAYEALRGRERVQRVAGQLGRGLSIVAPYVLSITTFVGGLVLLFSGATPAQSGRLGWLSDVLPLPVIEVSHFLGSVTGACLVVLAWGLQRRVNAALHLTAGLLAAGIAFSLLKGLDYEEAILLTAMLAALVAARREFHRHASLFSERFTPAWAAAILGAVLAAAGLGIFAYTHIAYSSELWWRFTLDGDAPRFLRATVGTLAVVLGAGVLRLIRPGASEIHEPRPDDVERANRIAVRSPLTYPQLASLGDKAFLFHGDAFLMYAVEGRSWVSMGDPVGPVADCEALAWRFRELVDSHGGWPVFYQVRPGALPLYLDMGLALTKLGEEARVPLCEFDLEGSKRKAFRHTLRRLERDGVTFRVLARGDADPALDELRRVSDDWLERKNAQEKGFSLGFFDPGYLGRSRVAVAEAGGRIVAFANLLDGADLDELSVDLMRYSRDAPSSVMEYLILKLLLWGRDQGYRWFSLGMAPLAGLEARRLSPLWSRMGAAVFRYGEHFYNFRGLREYKAKFDPVWEPRYLASPGGLVLPRILVNVSTLIGGGLHGVLRR